MAVRFVLGRAGAGKTRYCLDAILAALASPSQSRLILLVPEQASFQMERALALRSPCGGYWRADVLSFSRLARRVLAESGGEPTFLDPHARALALRRVTAGLCEESGPFRVAARTPGFFAELDALIEELLRENVTPDELAAAAEKLGDAVQQSKVAELARIYRAYMSWLGPERIDPACQLAALRERVGQAAWLRGADIWVDGFAGFTGQELATLVSLTRIARELTITLLLDPAAAGVRDGRPPEPLDLFARTVTTYQRLCVMFRESGAACHPPVELATSPPPRFSTARELARLEAGLAGANDASEAGAAPSVHLVECATHLDELRAAARYIRQSVADSGGTLRYRDFAVIARDLSPFVNAVSEVFDEYAIPYFLDRRRPLRAHPLALFVRSLFDALQGDFSSEAMTRLLRTDLLPLHRQQAEDLAALVARHEVHGAETWRQAAWDFSADYDWEVRADEAPPRARRRTGSPQLDHARREVFAAIEPLLAVSTDEATTGAAWARGLFNSLLTLNVRGRIEQWIRDARARGDYEAGELHRLAWDGLCGLLDNLHDVLGDVPLAVGEAAALLAPALAEMSVGLAPPTVDQVLVSAIERSRHPDIRFAWVFAFNEGVFPARPVDEVLLSHDEREALAVAGLPAPTPRRQDAFGERLLAYIAFTRPSAGLTISYAALDAAGEPLPPSPLLADLRRALPSLRIQPADESAPPVVLVEAARGWLANRITAMGDAQRRHGRLVERLCGDSRFAPALQRMLRGVQYSNGPAALGEWKRSDDWPARLAWRGSPSELEEYLQCPFRHLASFGLRLEAQRGPRPVTWDLGIIAHRILAEVTTAGQAEHGGVRDVRDERWLELLHAAIERFKQVLPSDLPFRRPQVLFLADCLFGFLRDVVLVHAERWRRGRFEPLGCEQPFDEQGAPGFQPLEFELPEQRIAVLRGKIDRIDVCDSDTGRLLLVYDYKSQTFPLRAPQLTGATLQLFLYLAALEQHFGTQPGTLCAGALVAPLRPNFAQTKRAGFRMASPADQLLLLFRPRGLFDERAAEMLDTTARAADSAVALMPRTTEGDFYKRGCDATTSGQIAARVDLARRTALQVMKGVVAGDVSIAPLMVRKTLACTTCSFLPVCRYDRMINRPRRPEAALPSLPQPASPEITDEEGDA